MRIQRVVAPLSAFVIVAMGLPTVATAATTGSSSVERVLLTLKPQDRGALRALAHGTQTRGSAGATALTRALPSAQQRQSVAEVARSLGLSVDRVGTMAIAAHGPASLVQRLFGSARAVDPSSTMQHPLPAVPSALRQYVTVAFGGDDNRPALRHFALPNGTADGTDFRTAYADTDVDPLTPPSQAEKDEAIATVQLSGWHPSDLSKYAAYLRQQTGNPAWPTPKYVGIDDPFLPSCVATDNNARTCSNFPGDDIEVDLDQEAIYSVAPYAHQRAYTSANDLFGLYDSLIAIGDDASDPRGDRHLVAATISWGFCETDLNGDPSSNELYAAFEDVFSYVLATGVTVFASSGDTGSLCDGVRPGVGYPASSPQVVAVGGTQYATSVATNPPTGWVDPGWTPGDTSGRGASSGGESAVFPQPQYQHDAGIAAKNRAVPDISAMAGDPGFTVYSTSPEDTPPNTFAVGGTSVSSPVVAATYAVQVAQHGYSWGVGDILPGLYRQPTNFTDVDDACTAAVTSTCPGWNGVDVAHTGYDKVTGLGTPKWSSLVSAQLGGDPHLTVGKAYNSDTRVPVTVHTADWQNFNRYRIDVDTDHVCTVSNTTATKPTSVLVDDFGLKGLADGVHDLTLVAFNSTEQVCHFADAFVFIDTTKPVPMARLSVGRGTKDVVASWGGGDQGGSGIRTWKVKLGFPGRTILSKTVSHRDSVRVPAVRGKTYTLTVTATDFAGNTRTTTATLLDDTDLSLAGAWSRDKASADFDGSAATSDRKGARATAGISGKAYTVYFTTCRTCGKAAVYVDGRKVDTVNTYSAKTHHRVGVRVFVSRRADRRTVRVKVLGRHSGASRGNDVFVDALTSEG